LKNDITLMMPSEGKREMEMNEQDERNLLKSIYLLQLRKPFFTKAELMEKTGLETSKADETLRQFTTSGMLKRRNVNEYVLLPKGRSKLRIVLVGGVYDILHLGHLAVLAEAKTYGNVLVAVVATDTTVETLKGRRPVFLEEDRRALVESLKPVDAAILGYEDVGMGYEQVIQEVKPDIIALGYDQDSVARTVVELVEKKKLDVRIVRLSKFDREKYLSSSAIRQRFFQETN
jgi:cytidyltransferase-like protein